MPISKAQTKKQRFRQLQENKRPFEKLYQLIARYIDMRSVYFSDQGQSTITNIIPEEIQNNDVSHISESASSALLGALWPNGASSFRIDRHRSIPDTQEIKNFFKEIVNPNMVDVMDNHRNGLLLALEEAISEFVNFGVTSVFIKENPDSFTKPVSYTCWDVKGNFIDENSDKFVDTIARLKQMDVRTAVEEYGYKNVSVKIQRSYNSQLYEEKVIVLIMIEPRDVTKQIKKGNLGMPFEITHMEFDTNKMLSEGGFEEFPVPTARYKKKPDEVWGRGAGGQAMPDVIELNVIWEAITIAFEKYLDPPLGVLDDGRMGGGDIDTSAGSLVVIQTDAGTRKISDVIAPIITTSEPSGAIGLIDKLTQSVSQHFMLDRLLDLNNQTEMTLGEAQIRDSLRSDSLRKVYARSIAELFIPIITRTFNILFRRGFFGVIPGSTQELEFILSGREYTYLPDAIIKSIVQGKDFYKIRFISPAARMLQIEESNGIITILRVATEAAAAFPHALDSFNIDDMLTRLAAILGVSVEVLNSTDTVKLIRENRAQLNAQETQIAQAKEISEIRRNEAQAQATADKNEQV